MSFNVPEHNSNEWGAFIQAIQYTPDWQKFVLSLFEKSEMKEGCPTADGLWRVARYVFKSPLSYTTTVNKPPSLDDSGAPVSVSLNYFGYSYSGVADVNPYNTQEPFSRHPSATAETKALGRALKKLLGLSIHTYEEMLDDGAIERASDEQVKSVQNLCKRLGVNIEKFLAENGGLTLEQIDSPIPSIDREHAFNLIEVLNSFQGKKSCVPDHLKE